LLTRNQLGAILRIPRILTSLFILALSVLLMGQAEKCDLSSFIRKVDRLFGSQNKTSRIYISSLSLWDVDAQSIFVASNAELINQVVERLLVTLTSQEPRYVLNDPNHTLVNNDSNALKLDTILWGDAILSKSQKVDKIIDDFMTPNGIDGLVAGRLQEKGDGSILVCPFLIVRSTKNFVTESRIFKKDEFECLDPSMPGKKTLCDKTVEDIVEAIRRVLD
jgi:hypothetical protein